MAKEKAEEKLTRRNEKEKSPVEQDWSDVPFWTSQRFLTAIVTFWGFAVLYLQRVNLSIAMVCMIKPSATNSSFTFESIGTNDSFAYEVSSNWTTARTDISLQNGTTILSATVQSFVAGDDGYCESLDLKTVSDKTGEFTWSKEMQGLLLGSFFWGYLVLQIPGGMLSERYGPRRVVFYTMLPAAILNLISPVSARVDPWLFLVIRVLIGVGESALYPAAQALFARWSPKSERSRLVGVSLSGGQFGNALIFPIGGLLCSSAGWDSVFYVMGAIGFLWCFIWYFLVFDSPALSTRISPLEREYIQHHVTFRDGQKQQPKPWKAIFTSVPFWAILLAHTCGNYGLYMLLTQIPTYMKEVLKFDLKSNGAFSMLPYLTMWLCISIAGTVSDILIVRKVMPYLWVRKLMSSIGMFGPALCLVGVTFMDCTQQISAVVLLCGCVGLSGIAFAGYLVNHGDIAPQFAGTLFGITNTAATVPGIVAPYVVGAITTNKTREEWQVAFFIAAAIYVTGGLFYLVFAQTTLQKWAQVNPDSSYGLKLDVTESDSMIDKKSGLLEENNV